MNRYTDATGAVYTVQSGYQTGDFVLLCDDGVSKTAWRMPKKHLRDASPVFKDIFAQSTSTSARGEPHLPDETLAQATVFIECLFKRTPTSTPSWIDAQRPLELFIQYKCADSARRFFRRITTSNVQSGSGYVPGTATLDLGRYPYPTCIPL
ncbi:uncharacterized protein MKK02DRAFT_32067 [Dioszegia hungarica]|uniref:BTB domain-containing protein n=1 Tax=Dioszegia hungarica TaxID=4972 RepID=A0AA38HEI6_9TREE|nr:uncharacterized protein MKK02DRAFT_32067 [Dioszegia hungarica]KAI9638677.1 hypothetical protein MKK02DRAFT_32067 [Dioszegia hungarica]